MGSSRSSFPSTSWASPSSALEELEKHVECLRRRRRQRLQDPELRAQVEQRRAQRNVQAVKRSQWKAASARYYENHPEVRERKRLKMAEQRAAKKLARRRWDPPKTPKRCEPSAANTSPRQSDSDTDDTQAREVTAAESLLFLHRHAKRRRVSVVPSDHIPKSEGEGVGE
ncbi:hypothetical protein B0H19DRAFT_1065670 [Mycena capillaripes]|nr:hypothetical protein B0H19DRAFT_1065670 [Mycena capillaripes]